MLNANTVFFNEWTIGEIAAAKAPIPQ